MSFGIVNPLGTLGILFPNPSPARAIKDTSLNQTLVANITIEEEHDDEVRIVDHPVEQGAVITDHAVVLPAELRLRLGWSNSSAEAFLAQGTTQQILGALGIPLSLTNLPPVNSYVQKIYDQLLTMKTNRSLLQVVTGKRVYQNMLIRGLSTTTTSRTENSLIISVFLRELILLNTQVTVVPINALQKSPADTGTPQDAGPKQLAPAPNVNESALPPGLP